MAGTTTLVRAVAAGCLASAALLVTVSVAGAQLSAVGNQAWTQSPLGFLPEGSDKFGFATVAGDFNNDGFDDLAIGVPGQGVFNGVTTIAGAGGVHVLYGGPGRLSTLGDSYWTQETGTVAGAAGQGDAFASALAACDFDGDGYDDLAIGNPFDDASGISAAGTVNILYGSFLGIVDDSNQIWYQGLAGSPAVLGTPQVIDGFGTALACGYLNNDSYADLAISAPEEHVGAVENAGVVHILYGSAGVGLVSVGNQEIDENDIAGAMATSNSRMGSTLASCDFDGNGRDDLAIGLWDKKIGADGTAGMVHVLYSDNQGVDPLSSDNWDQANSYAFGAVQSGAAFGGALACGRFNAGPHADLAIGAPGTDLPFRGSSSNIGTLTLLYGGQSGLSSNGSALLTQDSLAIGTFAENADQFAKELAAGDLDGDGFDDLIIGTQYESLGGGDQRGGTVTSAGVVQTVQGSASGLDLAAVGYFRQGLNGIQQFAEDFDYLGGATSRGAMPLAVGDFDQSGAGDLVIGTPHEDLVVVRAPETEGVEPGGGRLPQVPDAGVVHVLYGSLFSDGFESGDGLEWFSLTP